MFIKEKTIDDLLLSLYTSIELQPKSTITTSRGECIEELGVYLKLTNPLSRVSWSVSRGKAFSALGEFLWYVSGSDKLDFIEYYIPKYIDESTNGESVHGAYGKRIYCQEYCQIEQVISLLSQKPNTRRAVIQLFKVEDLNVELKNIPCTLSLQFFIRHSKLDMHVFMRSNDAYKGLPHDIFSFTLLQEYIARRLNVELGTYNHFVSSMHVYKSDISKVKKYISDGYQSSSSTMTKMPFEKPKENLDILLLYESKIRKKGIASAKGINDYWADLITLLNMYRCFKDKDSVEFERQMSLLNNTGYRQLAKEKFSQLVGKI